MAYKQSPFPLIEGTSPVKSIHGLLARQLVKYGKRGIKAVKTGYQKYVSGTKGPHSLKGVTDPYMKSKLTRMNVQANRAVSTVKSSGTTAPTTSYTTTPVSESFKFVDRTKSGKTAVETYKSTSGKIKQFTFVDTPGGPKRLFQSGDFSKAVKRAVKP